MVVLSHVDKSITLGLVVNQMGESTYQSLLTEPWHVHHCTIHIRVQHLNLGLTDSRSNIPHCLIHTAHHQMILLSEDRPLPLLARTRTTTDLHCILGCFSKDL